jgi:hypothetical protein
MGDVVSDFGYIGGQKAEVRCYRSAAFTTSSSGTFVSLEWDAESSAPIKLGIEHSTSSSSENLTCEVAGTYDLKASIKVVGGTWDEIRARVEVNGVAKDTSPVLGATGGLLNLVAGPGTLTISCTLWLVAGDVVRVRVASVGQANVALTVGETETWLELVQR